MKSTTLTRTVALGLALADASFPLGLEARGYSGPPLRDDDEGGSINLATASRDGQFAEVTVEFYGADEPRAPCDETWSLNGDSAATGYLFRRTTELPLTLRSFDEEVVEVPLDVPTGAYEWEVWVKGRDAALTYWTKYHQSPRPLLEHWIIRVWPSGIASEDRGVG